MWEFGVGTEGLSRWNLSYNFSSIMFISKARKVHSKARRELLETSRIKQLWKREHAAAIIPIPDEAPAAHLVLGLKGVTQFT